MKIFLLFGFFILVSCSTEKNNDFTLVEEEIIEFNHEDILLEQEELFDAGFFYDFESDDSITKYVSPNIPFLDKEYIPYDLIELKGEYIVDVKGSQTIRKESKIFLDKLGEAFYNEFGEKLVVISAYRSYEYQLGIKKGGCSDDFCAKAGYSEHQSGLAVDFFEATNKNNFLSNPKYEKYFHWLKENAHEYGYHNTYQKGRDIDGYAIEPWHWRYLGIPLASYLHENDMTFGEYFNNLDI